MTYTNKTRTDTLVSRRVTLTYTSTGLPVNLDDVTEIVTEVRYKDKRGTVVSSLKKTDMTITDPATGVFVIPSIDTLNWQSGKYYSDIRFIINGIRITPENLKSTFTIEQNVSNPS